MWETLPSILSATLFWFSLPIKLVIALLAGPGFSGALFLDTVAEAVVEFLSIFL